MIEKLLIEGVDVLRGSNHIYSAALRQRFSGNCYGDKSTQGKDIARAQMLAKEFK
ncbi:MAG: hypothetical protein ABI434_22955 [Burkholderiaceae bacterium]